MSLGLGTWISDKWQACDATSTVWWVQSKSDIQPLVVLASLLDTGSQNVTDGEMARVFGTTGQFYVQYSSMVGNNETPAVSYDWSMFSSKARRSLMMLLLEHHQYIQSQKLKNKSTKN